MSRRAWLVVVLAAVLSGISGAVLAQPKAQTLNEPVVLSGPDVGFRIDDYEGSRPVGTLVVRVNGRWVEPKAVMQPVPLGGR